MLALAMTALLQGGTPVVIERSRIDPRAEVDFHAIVVPETVYVGQAVLYELGVFVSDEVRSRLRQNPQFVPPDLRSVLAYDLRDPAGARTVIRDGRAYEVHVFRRALFPIAPGRIDIPPARLTYQMPLGASFFSREETRTLQSEPVRIVAIAPPAAGRPASWTGAVGELRIRTVVTPGVIRVGDPFVVTLRVSGEANVHLLPRPDFTLPWASVVAGPERVVVDTLATRVRGWKDFDWLVTPNVDGSHTIPSVAYAFFDPLSRRYRVAESDAEPLRVSEGALATVDSAASVPTGRAPLPIRRVWRRPLPDAPDQSLWFWIVVAIAPLPGLARLVRERPRRAVAGSPAGELQQLAARGVHEPSQVRAALRRVITARLAPAVVPWGDAPALRRVLRHHGVTDASIEEAMTLFARIDGAAYGAASDGSRDLGAVAVAVSALIDREARRTTRPQPARKAFTAAALLLVAGGAAAQGVRSARASFDAAVRDYAGGEYATSARGFFDAARAVPASAAAWANAGSASWAAFDTAHAVVGWQRALRLNPLDDDARLRLTLVGTDAGAGRADVWPVPRRAPAWLAIALWLGAWYAIWRRRRRRIAASVAVASIALIALSQVQHGRLSDGRVAVVARPAALRVLPALGAESGPTPLTGEVVRIEERSGLWVRITADGDRAGWIDGARLLDLRARTLRQ